VHKNTNTKSVHIANSSILGNAYLVKGNQRKIDKKDC